MRSKNKRKREFLKMGERCRHFSIEELPSHLVLEILCSGRLSAMDLVCLELTSKTFGGSHGLHPFKFKSLVDFAAFQLCASHVTFARMGLNSQRELYDRCGGNWKRVLRFLQSVEQSSQMVETSLGNVLFHYIKLLLLFAFGTKEKKYFPHELSVAFFIEFNKLVI